MEISAQIKAACQPKTQKNKILCRRNNVGYKIPCKLCPATYYGETGENMHTRAKSHLTKFNSKSNKIRETSAFYKHIENSHGGLKVDENFESYFTFEITKAYQKVITRGVEEGTFVVNHQGEVLNSKNEWRQPKIIRTTIIQGGAEMAGGRVASFPVAGNTARGVTLAGRRIPPCPGVGSIGSTSVTNVARISEEQPGSTATTVFNTDI